MPRILGLTTVKLNGMFDVEVKNSRWDVKRATPQAVTPGGVVTALGAEMPSGSFDSVIPLTGAIDWRSLKDFSIEILDQETRKIVVFSATGCNWSGISGSSDLQSAVSGKSIPWVGEGVVKA